MNALMSSRSLYGLLGLAALCVVGCIAQILLEIVYHLPQDVNPVLAGLAQAAIFAVFGQGFFTQHQATLSDMRGAFVSAITAGSQSSAPTSSTTSSTSGSTAPAATASELPTRGGDA